MKCENCGNRTKGNTGLCRTCRSANHHAQKRIKAEGLIVDQAGGSWWIWDKRGTVLVIGRATMVQAICALHQDPVDEDENAGFISDSSRS